MSGGVRKFQDVADFNTKFRELCCYYSDLLASEGKKVRPIRGPDLPVFSALPLEKKQRAIDFITSALEVFEETRAEGYKLVDSPKLLWRSLRKLGWTPQSDVFDRIGDKDVVNVYSSEQVQVFQNLNFFDWVSLTLEELYANPWHQYSRRERHCAELAYQSAVEVFHGVRASTFSPDIPEHYVEEIDTAENRKFYIKIHTASPLRQNGNVVGLLAINRCREWDGVPCMVPLL